MTRPLIDTLPRPLVAVVMIAVGAVMRALAAIDRARARVGR